jgi:predicted PurR-regulated permease PerM
LDSDESSPPPTLSQRAKLVIVVSGCVLAIVFLLQIRDILSPFLWALVVSYLLSPIVNYLHVQGHLPRLWSIILIYTSIGLLLLAGSRYLFPRIYDEVTIFLEDLPRLVASVKDLVGPRPLGLDVDSMVLQAVSAGKAYTSNAKNAGNLLADAVVTAIKIFLFLVTTFYLLMDAPRLKGAVQQVIPPEYRDELTALGHQINITWQQYIRGELVLFVIMASATTVGLTVLGVPGALFLGLLSGALELLPLVGPLTAGALAVSVAYFNGTNPFGWSQLAYAGAVALMYFVFRQIEDYLVTPHVLGRAIRMHPLVVLFAVASGGVFAGLFGLIVAVPVAASVKAITIYLYAKLLDKPVEFAPIRTLGGGVIEIPLRGRTHHSNEDPVQQGTGAP